MATQPPNGEPQPQSEEVMHLLALVRADRTDDLEAAWMEAVENEAVSLGDLFAVLAEVFAKNNPKLMESLVWLLVSVWSERRGADAALDAAWRVRDLLPSSNVLREEIAGLYRTGHAGLPGIETLTEMTILRPEVALRDALPLLERFLRLPPGTYVSDSRRKSPGRVMGADAARKVLTVSFGESDRAYDAGSVEALEALPAEDFRAMAVFDRPALEALARDDPAGLVRRVLAAYGPRMGLRDLKLRLADVAVGADGWAKWWSAAKAAVKRDPLIEMSDGTQPDFFLRQRPVSYEAEVRERFQSAAGAEEKLLLALGYLNETGHDPAAEAGTLAAFAADLARLADPSGGAAPAEVAAALAVLSQIRKHLGEAAPPMPAAAAALAADRAALAAAVGAVRSDPLALAVLAFIRQGLPQDWPEVFAAALPGASQEACERIAADLAAAGRTDLVAEAAAAVMARPNESVAALAWLWKTAGQERYAEALAPLNRAQVAVRLFAAANEVALAPSIEKARRQDLLAQVRRTVSAKDFAVLRDVLNHTDAGWAKEIRTAVSRNSGLTDHLRVQVLEVLGKAHPVPITKIIPPWEEDVVYTTEAALEARRKQFEALVHGELARNSAAIGEAAARGDVSDNAEFQTALEERDRLTERANAMQAELVKARPIRPEMARSPAGGIGTTVRARRLASGAEETLTFLGPWDARPQQGIYYYRAPLALAFMGKGVGETVAFATEGGEERWEILEVRPAV